VQVNGWGTSEDAAPVVQEADRSDLHKSAGSAKGRDFHEKKTVGLEDQ